MSILHHAIAICGNELLQHLKRDVTAKRHSFSPMGGSFPVFSGLNFDIFFSVFEVTDFLHDSFLA